MLVAVGSNNHIKVKAAREVLPMYFSDTIVRGVDVLSGAPSQPCNQREIYLGADNRSLNAFESIENCYLGFGIESGLVTVPDEQLPRVNRTICSIFDGKKFYHGWGGAFDIPKKVAELIYRDKIELDTALFRLGYTRDPHIGRTEVGFIGEMTGGRVTRLDLFKTAIHMALAEYNLSKKKI